MQGYGGDNIRQKFTGYEKDQESGLDFAQARYYNSRHGRFTSVDPLNPVLGKQEASNPKEAEKEFRSYLKQPQNWNRYTYSLNNPLRYTDPDGFQPITVRINIIFDENSNYTEKEMQHFKNTYVAELQNNFKDVDINFDVTYNVGTATSSADHNKHEMTSGVVPGAINVFATKNSVGPAPEISHYKKGEVWLNTNGSSGNLTHGVIHVLGIFGGINGYTAQDNSGHDRIQLLSSELYTRTFGNPAEPATQKVQDHMRMMASGGYGFIGGFGQAKTGMTPTSQNPRPDVSKEYGFLREGAKRFEKK